MDKLCFKCNQKKSLSEFYRHPKSADGHLGKCKECTKDDVRANRARNIDKIREYDRMRGQLPERKKKVRQRYRERVSSPEMRALEWARKASWRANNAAKRSAHLLVQYAVRRGDIKKLPCERCLNPKSDAHHENYTKPLDVVWLCKECHGERHREINKERRGE